MARAPVSTMLSSDNPRPPPQRRRTSSGRRLTAVAAATAAASIEEGNEEEQAPVWRPVSFEKAKSEPSTAAPPPARRTTPGRPGTTCTLLASVGPSFLQAGSAQDSCSSVNSGCFDQGSSSGRGGGGGGGGGGSVCASPSSVASGTGRRRARTNSSASVLKAAATSSVTPRSTASAPMFSPGGGGGGRRHRGGGERPRSLPPPHGIPNSRSSGRPLRHHGQQGGGVAEVGGGHHPTRQRSSGGVPLPLPSPSPSPSPAAAAAAAAASWAEVEALALTSIVPAVREAADSVARLMKASGGGGGGGGNWVGWCGSVARTLRRAVRVLAKATAHDEQVERVLMEDIQESICEMSEIMQCYASRGLSAEEAFWSGLCHRRQSEAELAIALASQRLELVMKVRAGYSGGSSSSSLLEASDRHSRMQRRSSQEILEDSKTRLREWRLHQVEIPATEVEVVGDEVLGDGDGGGGGGGGGRGSEDKRNSTVSTTVYLGSCMGLNAAVKAFSFKGGGGGGGGGNGEGGNSGSSQRGSRHKVMGEEEEERESREGGGGGGGQLTRWRETLTFGGGHDDRRLRCRRWEAALVREVETLQRLRGPHIVTVFGIVVGSGGGGDSSGSDSGSDSDSDSDSEKRSRENNDAGDASKSSIKNDGRLLLAMELLPGGSLRQRLRMSAAATAAAAMHRTGAAAAAGEGSSESTAAPAPMPLDDRALRRIVGDVCSGMAHLADLGFVHGGLSSSNVLLDARGRAKISDLGPLLRTPVAGNTTRLRYTAPEVLAGEDTSLKSDAYSFGMLVLECLTRRLPWQQEDDEDAATTAAAIDDGTTTSSAVEDARLSRTVMSGDRPGVPGDAPRDLARVAKDCWAHDPASRPDMVRVLEDLYPTGLTATSAAAGVAAGESGEAVPTNSMTTRVDDDDDHHHHRHGEARVLHGDEDDSSGLRPGPRGAGAVRRTRGIGDGTTPRSFELSSPRKMFPFPSSGAGSPLATMTTPGTPCSSSGRSRRRATSLETFSTLGVSSTTSSARSSVSRHVRGASAGGGGGGRGGRVLGVGGGIAGGGVLFAERSHTMPVRTQRSRSRKGDGADAPSRAESLPCVQYLAAQEISHQ